VGERPGHSPARGEDPDGRRIPVMLPGPERVHYGVLGLGRRPEGGAGGGVAAAERQHGPRARGVDRGEDAAEHRADAHAAGVRQRRAPRGRPGDMPSRRAVTLHLLDLLLDLLAFFQHGFSHVM
jgi:hypothetical protein